MVPLKRPGAIVTLLRFVKWMIVTDPRRAFVSIGLNVLQGIYPAFSVYFASRIFTQMMHVYDGTSDVRPLMEWIAAWALVSLLQNVLRTIETIYTERLRQEMEDSLLRQLQNKAARLRLEAFERSDFHDLLARAKRMALPGQFLNLLWDFYGMVHSAVSMVSLAVLVGSWNGWLLLALVVVALPEPIAGFIQAKTAFFLKRKQTEPERIMNYLATTLSSRESAKEMRTFDAAPWLLSWWETLHRSTTDALYRQERAQQHSRAGLSAFGALGLAAGAGWTAWTVAAGSLSAAGFGAMLFALQSMKGGVERVAGRFSGGTELSGGQWQRVAISRAFMRAAPLVVLDEPTAALDPKAEADVFARFAAMAGSRTAILVSHRLGMAKLCDRIMVLREGRLLELGSHDELLAAGGEYARLWSLQSQWYR